MYTRQLKVFQMSRFKAATTDYNVNNMVYIHIPIRTENLVLTQILNFTFKTVIKACLLSTGFTPGRYPEVSPQK